MVWTAYRCALVAMVGAVAALTVEPLLAAAPAKFIRQYVHTQWQDQLPHATVLTIAQTRDGYLWLGTYEGLTRFNGSEFVVFDKRNTPLEVAAVAALLEDSQGALWIGTSNAGLYRFVRGTMTRVAESAVGPNIHALAEDRQGTLWVASDLGIARLTRDGSVLPLPKGAPRTAVRWICAVENDVWLSSEGEGLVRYSSGRFVTYTTADGLSSNVTYGVQPSPMGLLIGSHRGGIDIFSEGRFRKPPFAADVSDTTVFRFAEDPDGSIWFTTDSKGVCHLIGDRLDCDPLTENPEFFRSLIVDRERNVWLGGSNTGLHRLTDAKLTTTTPETGSSSVRSVTEGMDGTIWAGMDGSGLRKLHNGRLVSVGPDLPNGAVRSVLTGRDGSLWVGTFGGLTHIRNDIATSYTVRDGLASNFVYALTLDGNGSLWVGTSRGVNKVRDGTISTVSSEAWADVRALHSDRGGRLWIGTRNGLRCLVEDRVVPCGNGMLQGASIFSFYEDGGGDLWIGTNRGLARVGKERTSVYSTTDGLFDNVAFGILEDDDGTLWMSSNKGIYRARRSDFDAFDRRQIASIPSLSYDKSDGMFATQCNGATQPAVWKGRDGQLWFATVRGLVSFDPKHLRRNAASPPVVIEQIRVDRRVVAERALGSLAPGARDFEFHYAALSFVAPEKIRYRYMLEGYDRGWIDAGTRHAAYYTNVGTGDYRFRVTAANNDGVWNEEGASVSMQIAPPFQETWWFRVLAFLAFCAVAALAYRVAIWRLHKNQLRLVALVAQQTEKLSEANVALEKLATIDPLTQVANRRSFDTALARMWAGHSRAGSSLAAILCDIDFFKKYNDTYGHQAGDDTLVRVAAALGSTVKRSTDLVARFGGEEFIILLQQTTLDQAELIAQAIIDSVHGLQIAHANSAAAPVVTVSLGVASVVPDPGTSPERLIHRADDALYRAKEAGRNRYVKATTW